MSTPFVHQNNGMKNMTYGDWLKEQRSRLRMSQAEVEKRADLGNRHLSKFENGHYRMPTEDVRLRIHAALGTTDEDLVEVGILRRMQYQGKTWYVPVRDEGRASQDAPPLPGALGLGEVSTALTDAARGITWTPAMLHAIVQQIKMYGEIQAGMGTPDSGESQNAPSSNDDHSGAAAN